MIKRREQRALLCTMLLIGASCLASPALSQSSSQMATDGRASLSNGLRAGMSAEEVAQIVSNLPDVQSAKAGGSKKNPSVKVRYVNDFSQIDGFDFEFAFLFQSGKLFAVDLVSRPICDGSIDNEKSKLIAKFSQVYGSPDTTGSFFKNNTEIYIFKKALPRSTYRGDAR